MKSPQCPKCGSADTYGQGVLTPGPSLFYTILLDWLYLLARAAFARKSWTCRHCGARFRHRTLGSYIALLILALLLILIIIAGFQPASSL